MVIGIAGNINSGKDTVASILNYLFVVGKHKAKYSDWLIKQKVYDKNYSNRVIHFADSIKDNLSTIFGVSRELFDDRKYKDELWYVPSTGKFIKEKDVKDEHIKFTLETQSEALYNKNVIVKLRTLIQLYAEHIKTIFGENIWINNTINNAEGTKFIFGYCLIPDVRFYEELKSIWKINGIVIKVERPNNKIKVNHASENNNLPCNYTIENSDSLSELFYKTLAIYEKIKN